MSCGRWTPRPPEIALGKLTINVLNAYGGFMSMVTSISGFRGRRVLSQRGRAAYIGLIMAAGTGGAAQFQQGG